MIEDPPLMSIRKNFARPTADQVNDFQGVPCGFVVDAMQGRGALDYQIKPISNDHAVFAGVAVTCDNGPADNLAAFCAIEVAAPGDVILAAADGFTETAVSGDLMLGMARNKGIAAFVTDGLVRDIEGIVEVGMPCFAKGVTPNSPVRNGPGTVGMPIIIGGVAAQSGDIVVGDINGVVVVPHAMINHVLDQLETIKKAEKEMDEKVKAGLSTPPFIEGFINSNQIKEID